MTGQPRDRGWRNSGVVRERDHHRVRSLWLWIFSIAAALSPLAFYLVQQMEYVKVRYEIETLRAAEESLAEEERRLRVERASLESLSRVEGKAIRELGLRYPATDDVVVVVQREREAGTLMARVPDEETTVP